jgi:hypothetical protein
VKALRARIARLLFFLKRYGVRTTIRRAFASRTSPLFAISAAQVGLAHVTRVDRSSSRLIVHGRGPSGAAQLKCAAVVPRHLAVLSVELRRTGDAFELDVPLQKLARLDGVCETRFVLTGGSDRWILGRAPQPELYLDGAVNVPLTVVALPGGAFMRLRVTPQPDGELRVVSERFSGKVAA